jgi:hypothetical protein
MYRGRFIFTAALALATVSAQAATQINSDFTLQDASRPANVWKTNRDAGLQLNADIGGTAPAPIVLKLTDNQQDQRGTAWSVQQFEVPSFTMWADVNVNWKPAPGAPVDTNCPADGFTMAFADVDASAVANGGGALALYGREETVPRAIAMEVNTWKDNAVEDAGDCSTGKSTTFGFADISKDTTLDRGPGDLDTGGGRLGQVTAPAKIVDGGWYRYQWNVDSAAGTMDLFITGLDESNKSVANQKVASIKLNAGAPKLNFKGRFGMTGATGGATQGTYVRSIRVDSPMVAAGEPPAAAPPTAGN